MNYGSGTTATDASGMAITDDTQVSDLINAPSFNPGKDSLGDQCVNFKHSDTSEYNSVSFVFSASQTFNTIFLMGAPLTMGDLENLHLYIQDSSATPVTRTACLDQVDGTGFYHCEGPIGDTLVV